MLDGPYWEYKESRESRIDRAIQQGSVFTLTESPTFIWTTAGCHSYPIPYSRRNIQNKKNLELIELSRLFSLGFLL
jgi:hypothetical protein